MLPSPNTRIVAIKALALSSLIFALPVAEAFAGRRIP